MTESHLATSELTWYVTTGLAMADRGWHDARLDRVESHASECESCAAALAREAELELVLVETSDDRPRRSKAAAWVASAFAVAALLVVIGLGFGSAASSAEPTAPAATMSVDAGVIELAADSSVLDDGLESAN